MSQTINECVLKTKAEMLEFLKSLSKEDDSVCEKIESIGHKIAVQGNAWDTIPRLNIGSKKKLPIDYHYMYHVFSAVIKCADGELEVYLLNHGMGKGLSFYSEFNVDAVLERIALEGHQSELSRQVGVEQHMWAEELLEGKTDEERYDMLNFASHIGIVENRNVGDEVIKHWMNNPSVHGRFGHMSNAEFRCLINYSLDCLNAKCRENGDPEIY